MSDAKPILSPAQVELCAREMGWRRTVPTPENGRQWWIEPGTSRSFDKLYDQTDPRFLWPLFCKLVLTGEEGVGAGLIDDLYTCERESDFASFVLQAALVEFCGEREG